MCDQNKQNISLCAMSIYCECFIHFYFIIIIQVFSTINCFVKIINDNNNPLFVPQWGNFSVSLCNEHRLPREAPLEISGSQMQAFLKYFSSLHHCQGKKTLSNQIFLQRTNLSFWQLEVYLKATQIKDRWNIQPKSDFINRICLFLFDLIQ